MWEARGWLAYVGGCLLATALVALLLPRLPPVAVPDGDSEEDAGWLATLPAPGVVLPPDAPPTHAARHLLRVVNGARALLAPDLPRVWLDQAATGQAREVLARALVGPLGTIPVCRGCYHTYAMDPLDLDDVLAVDEGEVSGYADLVRGPTWRSVGIAVGRRPDGVAVAVLVFRGGP